MWLPQRTNMHRVMSVEIMCFFGSVFSRIRTEYGDYRANTGKHSLEKTPYLHTFHTVYN